jgi:hypothetical protein
MSNAKQIYTNNDLEFLARTRAEYLIARGYPVGNKTVDELTDVLMKKLKKQNERSKS